MAKTRGVCGVNVGHAVVQQEHAQPGANPAGANHAPGLRRIDARSLGNKVQRKAQARAGVVWRVVVVRIVGRIAAERRARASLERDVNAQVDATLPRRVAGKPTADPSSPPVPARQYFDRKHWHDVDR